MAICQKELGCKVLALGPTHQVANDLGKALRELVLRRGGDGKDVHVTQKASLQTFYRQSERANTGGVVEKDYTTHVGVKAQIEESLLTHLTLDANSKDEMVQGEISLHKTLQQLLTAAMIPKGQDGRSAEQLSRMESLAKNVDSKYGLGTYI
ncbi:hypothetical protein HYFRA_00009185 [Hymenoscyphus fraxineus]|uniref:Uncharacterized protein n=1 Tax=Hymenoscyphus fraxineus TaxID=746836 RepID=A0A9N9PU20_9HELO|nr:hypothetical protein HYFRA_00009185 [Hymenoscyphus fraxineus]